VIRANLVLTAVFAATAAYAAADFSTTAQWIGAATAMTLFAIGVFAFLWSYYSAVQRSRTDEIAVSQLYLLMGPAIPAKVRRTMNLMLVTQLAIALVTTLVRPDGPDGNPGSSLAVGFLVPMLGFGLNGLWAVTHGAFEPRREAVQRASQDTAPDEQIGQNADHG
jgi:peptidoglycan/LPS O-acetylase OafA/YrhL